jgi:hypothetical protein
MLFFPSKVDARRCIIIDRFIDYSIPCIVNIPIHNGECSLSICTSLYTSLFISLSIYLFSPISLHTFATHATS